MAAGADQPASETEPEADSVPGPEAEPAPESQPEAEAFPEAVAAAAPEPEAEAAAPEPETQVEAAPEPEVEAPAPVEPEAEAAAPEPEPAPEPPVEEDLQETDLRVGPAPAPEPVPGPPPARRGGPSKKISSTLGAAAWVAPTPVPPTPPAAPPPGAGPAAPGSQPAATQPSATQPTSTPATGAISGWGQGAGAAGAAVGSGAGAAASQPPAAPPQPPPAVRPQQPAPQQPTAQQPVAQQPTARPPQAIPEQPVARPPQPTDEQPIARRPTDEVAPKPRPVASVEQRVAQPGDRICGACGEPNDPARKFCRRCGANIVEAKLVAAPRLPWYRRLFGGGKESRQYAAGERTKSTQKTAPKGNPLASITKGRNAVMGVVGVLVAIGLIGYVSIPSVQGTVNRFADPIMHGGPGQIIENIKQLIAPTYVTVTPDPDTVRATDQLEGFEGRRAVDVFSNTDWRFTNPDARLEVGFEDPIDLGWVIVKTGNLAAFSEFRRPVTLTLQFPDGSTQILNLQDVKDDQPFEVKRDDLESVTVFVSDIRGPDDKPISITEIEFQAKATTSTP